MLASSPALAQQGDAAPDKPAPSEKAPASAGDADSGEAGDTDTEAQPAPAGVAPLSESLSGMAKAEYEAGRILYADGDYKGASQKFKTAYEQSSDPRLLWNMAAAEKNQRHYVDVIGLVKRYISEAASMLSAQDFEDANALLKTVEGFVGEVTFKVNQPGAEVHVDEKLVGTTPLPGSVLLDMGDRQIRVSKPGFLPFRTTWNVPGGSPSTMEISLEEEVHQGRLQLVAGEGDTIRIDGKVMGAGQWEGVLPSGVHNVEVSAPGKLTYTSDVGVRDNELTTLRITLEAERAAEEGGGGWWWVAGGAVVAGLGVGAYYLLRPEDPEPPPYVQGSLAPGVIPLGLGF